MSNAWIDDGLYRQPWVRSCGPLAVHAYLAAINLIHADVREAPAVTRQELLDELPWPTSTEELDRALERLAARDKVALAGDLVELVLYEAEQESNAKRRDRSATNRRIAREAIKSRQRNSSGMLVPSSASLVSALVQPASGPVRSDPVLSKEPSGPPPAPPTPAPKKPRKKREYHPNYRQAVDILDRHYSKASGSKPDWKSPKNQHAADDLAKRFPLEEIEIRARRFWVEHLPAFVWNGKLTCPTVADFRTHFERLAVIQSRLMDDDFIPLPPTNGHANGLSRI